VQIDVHERDRRFFDAVVRDLATGSRPQLVLLTHMLPDRPPLIDAFASLADVVSLIMIPYSADRFTVEALEREGHVIQKPTMTQLDDPSYLADLLARVEGDPSRPLVICEIGGYFAKVPGLIEGTAAPALAGVVEDTEAGHRRYVAAAANAALPIVSAARSPLKEPEDRLIGESVAFSLERILRDHETVLSGARVTVLGFGKIGSSCANALRARGAAVSVFDIDAVRRVRAAADGFAIPDRPAALRSADIVVGATGTPSVSTADLTVLRDRCLLCSASSRKVEFAIDRTDAGPALDGRMTIIPRGHGDPVFLLNDGAPINFLDRGVVGPILRLVQSELLAAVARIAAGDVGPGLTEVDATVRSALSARWIEAYVDPEDGLSRH
jgi:adenosylhomocysteinase